MPECSDASASPFWACRLISKVRPAGHAQEPLRDRVTFLSGIQPNWLVRESAARRQRSEYPQKRSASPSPKVAFSQNHPIAYRTINR